MSSLTITPLGTSPAFYNPGEPTSGYLLEADGLRVLVDCGSGVVARYLSRYGTDAPLDAVVISHIHADHVVDLVPLGYGLSIGDLQVWNRPQLWLPPGGAARLSRFVSAFDGSPTFFADAFELEEYGPSTAFVLGSVTVTPAEVPHFIECWALRFDTPAGASITYSADLGMSPALIRLATGTDLLVCEATYGTGAPSDGHLTAHEAGIIARDAGAARLLLTHVPMAERTDACLAAAAAAFAGPVAFATSDVACAAAPIAAVHCE